MRSPYGPSRQRHWGRTWDREIGDPWGARGGENPSLRQARAMQNGEYLGGVDNMNQNEMNADGEDELLAAELQDDVVGSGIFDDPRRATANPDMGVLASRYALPGYLARERPFVPSEDVISASGAQVVPVPAGGASYVTSAAVGPNYELEQQEMNVPGVHRTLATDAPSSIELLGEDAVAMPPKLAALDNPYYVEDSADAYLRPMYEGRTMVQFSGPENAHGGNPHAKGRKIAYELYEWSKNHGVGTGARPHPVWGTTKGEGKPTWAGGTRPSANPLLLPGLIPQRPSAILRPQLQQPTAAPWPQLRRPSPPSYPVLRRPFEPVPPRLPQPYLSPATDETGLVPVGVATQKGSQDGRGPGLGRMVIRPFQPPQQIAGLGVDEGSGSSGLGTYLAYGLALGIVGSMIYHATKR